MKTLEIKLYSFDELSKAAQEKAIVYFLDSVCQDEWWENTYEDAANIGLKIESFDIEGGNYCKGEFTLSAHEVAANIVGQHGETCETNKTAQTFLDDVNSFEQTDDNEPGEGEQYESKMMELEEDFLQSLCEDYRIILRNEYEYLTGEEAVKETIEANEYLFYADGELANVTHYCGKHEKAGITEVKFHGETFELA